MGYGTTFTCAISQLISIVRPSLGSRLGSRHHPPIITRGRLRRSARTSAQCESRRNRCHRRGASCTRPDIRLMDADPLDGPRMRCEDGSCASTSRTDLICEAVCRLQEGSSAESVRLGMLRRQQWRVPYWHPDKLGSLSRLRLDSTIDHELTGTSEAGMKPEEG